MKSDCAVPGTARETLRAAVARLEGVPDDEKDWHPNSDIQVLDLVHPSLFPLVYGRTRIIPDRILTVDDGVNLSGQGQVLPQGDAHLPPPRLWYYRPSRLDDSYSKKFQWLPCDVSLQSTADEDSRDYIKCQISSYINNLHPKEHADLYKVIEQIISCAIPLWNTALTALKSPPSRRILYDFVEYDPDPDMMGEGEYLPQEEGEDDAEYQDRFGEWKRGFLVRPEPGEFTPPPVPAYKFTKHDKQDNVQVLAPDETVDLYRDHSKSGLQVIIKLANIHLTPKKPEYQGGSWHVEGQMVSIYTPTVRSRTDPKLIDLPRTNTYVPRRSITMTAKTSLKATLHSARNARLKSRTSTTRRMSTIGSKTSLAAKNIPSVKKSAKSSASKAVCSHSQTHSSTVSPVSASKIRQDQAIARFSRCSLSTRTSASSPRRMFRHSEKTGGRRWSHGKMS